MATNTPCRDCEFRTLGCHATCELYKAFREKRLEQYKRNEEFVRVGDVLKGNKRRRK